MHTLAGQRLKRLPADRRSRCPDCRCTRPGGRRAGLRPDVFLRATSKDQGDVWSLHEQLVKEIKDRKKHQEQLVQKVSTLGLQQTPGAQAQAAPTTAAPTTTVPPLSAALRPPPAPTTGPGATASPAFRPPPPPAASTLQSLLLKQRAAAAGAAPSVTAAAAPPLVAPRPALPPLPPAPPAFAQSILEPQRQLQDALAPDLALDPAPEVDEDAVADGEEDDTPPAEPPLAGENVMNVVMVGAECAPWSKTGGLGDVMGALPKALRRRGHRVMVVAPRYSNYAEAWETGIRRVFRVFDQDVEVGYFHCYLDEVDYVFVDHPSFHAVAGNIYGGDRQAIQFRCALLCKAALEAVWHVTCGGVPYGDNNTVFIANDWHTALLPVYLQAHYRDYGQMTYSRAVFVIHNMAHQGRAPFVEAGSLELPPHYKEQLRLYDPIGGEHMNIMKAGLQNSHRLVAVSDGYAWECQTPEGGWGLDQVVRENAWKLRGIVNGIDYKEWSPMYDVHLDTDGYTRYDLDTLVEGKQQCKLALQRELGLPEDPDIPLLGFIGRLDYQKGVDLIRDSHGWLMSQGVQLVMLGSGREDLENDLRGMEAGARSQTRGWVGFSVKMAHRITAGADMLLMPSRFEPCGLNQLYAMAYGTVPIVHAVGGLRDTVRPYDPFADTGSGWTFDHADAEQLRTAVHYALTTYREHRDSFVTLQKRGMEQDLSWDHAAELYEQVLVAAKYQW